MNGPLCNLCALALAGVTYLRYSVLTSPNKDETAVHCCDPALSVLVMLVTQVVVYSLSLDLAKPEGGAHRLRC